MPSLLNCQQAAVIDIGGFGQLRRLIPHEYPIDLACSAKQFAIEIVAVETVVIHQFHSDVLVHDLRL